MIWSKDEKLLFFKRIVLKSVFDLNLPHVGLEPTHRQTLDPKSSASTNSASGAF